MPLFKIKRDSVKKPNEVHQTKTRKDGIKQYVIRLFPDREDCEEITNKLLNLYDAINKEQLSHYIPAQVMDQERDLKSFGLFLEKKKRFLILLKENKISDVVIVSLLKSYEYNSGTIIRVLVQDEELYDAFMDNKFSINLFLALCDSINSDHGYNVAEVLRLVISDDLQMLIKLGVLTEKHIIDLAKFDRTKYYSGTLNNDRLFYTVNILRRLCHDEINHRLITGAIDFDKVLSKAKDERLNQYSIEWDQIPGRNNKDATEIALHVLDSFIKDIVGADYYLIEHIKVLRNYIEEIYDLRINSETPICEQLEILGVPHGEWQGMLPKIRFLEEDKASKGYFCFACGVYLDLYYRSDDEQVSVSNTINAQHAAISFYLKAASELSESHDWIGTRLCHMLIEYYDITSIAKRLGEMDLSSYKKILFNPSFFKPAPVEFGFIEHPLTVREEEQTPALELVELASLEQSERISLSKKHLEFMKESLKQFLEMISTPQEETVLDKQFSIELIKYKVIFILSKLHCPEINSRYVERLEEEFQDCKKAFFTITSMQNSPEQLPRLVSRPH